MNGDVRMAARRSASANPSSSCRSPLRRFILLLIGCSFCSYVYVWRHYFALVLQPPSRSFKYRDHYQETFGNADARQVTKLRKELTESLPIWLAEYTEWHAQARASLVNINNNNNTRILIVSIEEHHSGGLADRLRSLPFFLWEAARTKRLFLMQWMNPRALQEFLLPPLGGIDWTVPAHIVVNDSSNSTAWHLYNDDSDHVLLADNDAYLHYSVIKTWHNPWTFVEGMPLMAKKALNTTSLTDPIFSHIYRLLLTPSPPVQDLIQITMKSLGITTGNFNGIHLRARYPGTSTAFQSKGFFSRSVDADGFKWTSTAQQQVLQLATHAIDCLEETTLYDANDTARPIYFASDTNQAVKFMVKHAQQVVGMVTPLEKMHLNRNDRIGLIRKTPPSAFYPAIVDLWILSQAKCLAVGSGGYGLFAAILGGTDCLLLHSENTFVGSYAKICPNEHKEG